MLLISEHFLKHLHNDVHLLEIQNCRICTFYAVWEELRNIIAYHHHTTTVLWPFFRDHPGEPVPEENFWTLWCKGRLTEADTLTIRLGATPSGLTSAYLHHPPYYRLFIAYRIRYHSAAIMEGWCHSIAHYSRAAHFDYYSTMWHLQLSFVPANAGSVYLY